MILGPIFPAAPRTMRSPSSDAVSAISASDGAVSLSFNSASERKTLVLHAGAQRKFSVCSAYTPIVLPDGKHVNRRRLVVLTPGAHSLSNQHASTIATSENARTIAPFVLAVIRARVRH